MKIVRGVLISFLLAIGSSSLLFAQTFDSLLRELTGSGEKQDDNTSPTQSHEAVASQVNETPQLNTPVSPSGVEKPSESQTVTEPSSPPKEATVASEVQKTDALPPLPIGPLAPSSLDMMATLEGEEEAAPPQNIPTNGVVLQGLDKTTARVFITKAHVGQEIEFGTLKITVQRCEKTPPEMRPDSMAFVTIAEVKPNRSSCPVFSGWMFASSPSLSFLDHPLYDVWIKECKNIKTKKRR